MAKQLEEFILFFAYFLLVKFSYTLVVFELQESSVVCHNFTFVCSTLCDTWYMFEISIRILGVSNGLCEHAREKRRQELKVLSVSLNLTCKSSQDLQQLCKHMQPYSPTVRHPELGHIFSQHDSNVWHLHVFIETGRRRSS